LFEIALATRLEEDNEQVHFFSKSAPPPLQGFAFERTLRMQFHVPKIGGQRMDFARYHYPAI